MPKVEADTPWGRVVVEAGPHGSPRILHVAKSHPDSVGVGVAPPGRTDRQRVLFVFSSQKGADQFGEYLASRGEEEKARFFDIETRVAPSQKAVPEVETWL